MNLIYHAKLVNLELDKLRPKIINQIELSSNEISFIIEHDLKVHTEIIYENKYYKYVVDIIPVDDKFFGLEYIKGVYSLKRIQNVPSFYPAQILREYQKKVIMNPVAGYVKRND